MGKLTTALIFVLVLNVFMIIFQMAQANVNPGNETSPSPKWIDTNGNVICSVEAHNCQGDPNTWSLNSANSSNDIPLSVTIQSNTGFTFTDVYSTVRNWLTTPGTGLNLVTSVLAGPGFFIYKMFPASLSPVAYLIIGLWYLVTFFLVINFLRGGDV